MIPRVAVIGGGPAGLMAADVISAAGIAVTIYDAMPSLGRKLLMAGRGGLNLTHSEPIEILLARYGAARTWLSPVIRRFPPEALVALANGLGQETFTGSSGRIFPRAMKASPLLRAWLGRLGGRGVEVRLRHRWLGLDDAGRLQFATPDGATTSVEAAATVLALGGASWPRLGSDGRWTAALAGLGVPLSPLAPANAGVVIGWSAHLVERMAGTPLKRIAVTVGSEHRKGEAVLTRSGLEGGVIYALNPAIRAAFARDGRAKLVLDLRPDLAVADLALRLEGPRAKQSMATVLRKAAGLAPIGIALLHEAAGRTLPVEPSALAGLIKAVPLQVAGFAGLERAISSAGGVRHEAVGADMMLAHRPGLFVAGEMLDWDAPTGGYLLQAAFATGHAAGEGVLAYLGQGDADAVAESGGQTAPQSGD